MDKNLRIILGVLLHPMKSLYYKARRGGYKVISERVNYSHEQKAFYRTMFLKSLTGNYCEL